MITGFSLAFARGRPVRLSRFRIRQQAVQTEIAPILIVTRLEEFAYGEATAIAMVLLVLSFTMLVLINKVERWSMRHER